MNVREKFWMGGCTQEEIETALPSTGSSKSYCSLGSAARYFRIMNGIRPVVSYHTAPYKALSLAGPGAKIEFSDFSVLNTGQAPQVETVVRLSWQKDFLILKADCFDPHPERILAGNKADESGIWNGDELEIFFGLRGGEFFQWQLCIGAGGGRFDSLGSYLRWHADTVVDSSGWHAEIRLPLCELPLREARLSLNVCRQIPHLKEYLSWSPVQTKFEQIGNHGDLFFTSWKQAFFQLTGKIAEQPLDRRSFEALVTGNSISALALTDGPFLLQPTGNRISVLWKTAGSCAGALEYRKRGEKRWKTVYADLNNAVLDQRSSSHRADLSGLTSGAEYEYRLKSFHSDNGGGPVLFPENGCFHFRGPGKSRENLSFMFISDLHSQTQILSRWLELGKDCDFILYGGDYLGSSPCIGSYMSSFLKRQHEISPEQPAVVVRGNHEFDAPFASDFQFLTFHSGKTYDCFSLGKICFLILDAGNVHDDESSMGIHHSTGMIRKECVWLEKILQSETWRKAECRLAVMHMPPYTSKRYDGKAAQKLADVLSAGEIRPDLMLCGHLHKYGRWGFRGMPDPFPPLSGDLPEIGFPVICNANNTALLVRCAADRIDVEAFDDSRKVFDRITVTI